MAIPSATERLILNFGWKGPSSWRGGWSHGGLDIGVVDLVFKNAKTDISVQIPDNISPATVQKLPFTCRKYLETEYELSGRKFKPLAQETHPSSLKVTVEQVHNLTIKAGIFEESPHKGPSMMDSAGRITYEKRIRRSDREIKLEVPEALEIGQIYTLVVTSDNFAFSARLQKEEKADAKVENTAPHNEEFQRRVRNMGEALVAEGINNLKLASEGGGNVFNATSTNADIYAHGIQGVIRSTQQINPEIRVPYTRPLERASDLDRLTTEELQSRFEATFKKDKEFESQRFRAARKGNIEEMNGIIAAEHANSQLLIKLGEALERRGVTPQIPQTESFQSAARQSAEDHEAALKKLGESCNQQ